MNTKQVIISIEYHALLAYFKAGVKRLKRTKKPSKIKELQLALAELQSAMDNLARAYQAETGEVIAMDGIIPPPPPGPPKEVWP